MPRFWQTSEIKFAPGKIGSILAERAVKVRNLDLDPEHGVQERGTVHMGQFSSASIAGIGGRWGGFGFDSELRGPDIAGQTFPEGRFLRASAFKETFVNEINGVATVGSTGTTLIDLTKTFIASGVELGTWINNTTQGKSCFVLQVVSETELLTTTLIDITGAASAGWVSADIYKIEQAAAWELGNPHLLSEGKGGNLDPVDIKHWMDGLQTSVLSTVLHCTLEMNARRFPMLMFDGLGQLDPATANWTTSGEVDSVAEGPFVAGARPFGLGSAGWKINVGGSNKPNQVAYRLRYDCNPTLHNGEGFNGHLGTEFPAICGFVPEIQMWVEVPGSLADCNYKDLAINHTDLWIHMVHGVETGFPFFVSFGANIIAMPEIEPRQGKAMYALELERADGPGGAATPNPLRIVNSGSV